MRPDVVADEPFTLTKDDEKDFEGMTGGEGEYINFTPEGPKMSKCAY